MELAKYIVKRICMNLYFIVKTLELIGITRGENSITTKSKNIIFKSRTLSKLVLYFWFSYFCALVVNTFPFQSYHVP